MFFVGLSGFGGELFSSEALLVVNPVRAAAPAARAPVLIISRLEKLSLSFKVSLFIAVSCYWWVKIFQENEFGL